MRRAPSEADIMAQGVQGRKLDGRLERLSYLQKKNWAKAGIAAARAGGRKDAPSEAQALLYVVDDNHANSACSLKNLVLVRSSAAARSTTNTLDGNLEQRQPDATRLTVRVDAQCSR